MSLFHDKVSFNTILFYWTYFCLTLTGENLILSNITWNRPEELVHHKDDIGQYIDITIKILQQIWQQFTGFTRLRSTILLTH